MSDPISLQSAPGEIWSRNLPLCRDSGSPGTRRSPSLGGWLVACGMLLLAGCAFSTPGPKPLALAAPALLPAVPESSAADAPEASAARVQIERDAAAVFQRAFWRRPGPDVRVVQAERRDWLDEQHGVMRWQWFIVCETQTEFRAWLLDQNPFALTAVAATGVEPSAATAPAWFPVDRSLQDLTAYRTPGGNFRVWVDAGSGRIFATDTGHGFTAAQRVAGGSRHE